MRYLSVCSGIEAATVAWDPLGWKPTAFAEIEKFPSAVLAHHYPSVPNLGDMNKFKSWTNESIDLLVGGTPCQAFSVAGLRKGLDDPRGNLTLVFLAMARRFCPRWIVWENVPGVLSDSTNAFGQLLGGLAQLGYCCAYRVLDAQFFGVPQRRRRVFIVGYLGAWQYPAAVLFEPESLRGDYPEGRAPGKGVAPSITSRPSGDGGLGTDFDLDGGIQLSAVTSKWSKGSGGPSADECQNLITHTFTTTWDASEDGSGRGIQIICKPEQDGETAPTLRAMGHAGSHPNAGGQVAVAFQESQSGVREYPEAGTLRHNGPGHDPVGTRIRESMSVRRITPRECERLQGFPDDYTLIPWRGKSASDGPRYKALGNSMAVPVMAWIGQRISFVDSIKV